MSYSLVNIYASLPRTNRGQAIVLGNDPKGKNFLYVNGNSVFIRNIDSPFQCDVYTEHSCPVYCAKYAPSGFYIASGDQSGKVRIWDTTNKEHLLKNEFQPISGIIKDLQWSLDNQRIIVGGEGREKFGHVFSADTGTSVGEIMGTSKAINSVDFKPTRPFRAVVASEDNSVCYFEGPPFKWKKSLNEHDRFVNCIRFSPNGDRFASGGADGKLVLYDGKTGDKMSEIGKPAHAGGIYSLCWDPTSQRILTASGDKTAKIWNADTGELIREFQFGNTVDDQQVGSLWQGSTVLTVSLSGFINYLDVNAGGVYKIVKGHSKSITALAIGKSMIYSASHDGLIIAWNAETGEMDSIKGNQHKSQVQQLAFLNGNLVSCAYDDTLKFIDPNCNQYTDEIKLDSQPQGVAFHSENTIVVACIKQLILIVNRKKVSTLNLNYETTCVSSRKSVMECAVGGKDNKVHVYQFNINNGFTETKTITERDYLTAIAYSHDEIYLAASDNNKNVKCYNINENYENITREMWQHHAGKITALSWSPDSKHLATSGIDTHAFIYSPPNLSNYIQIKSKICGFYSLYDNSHLFLF
jgi:WD repeat-containing protein 1 (actin-interacting protein 1)